MGLARQKLDRIEWISRTRDAKLVQKLTGLKQSQPTLESVPIRRAGWGKDVFVHASAVETSDLGTLNENQKISYEVERDSRSGKESAGQLKNAEG